MNHHFIQRYQGLLTGIIFLAYLFMLQPRLLALLSTSIDGGQKNQLLGLVFLALPALELAGLALKWPGFSVRLDRGGGSSSQFLFLAWIAHLAVNMVVALAGLDMAGFALAAEIPDDASLVEGLAPVAVFALVVLKELGLLLAVIGIDRQSHVAASPENFFLSPWRELAGNLLALPFSAAGFTLLWDFAAIRTPLNFENPGLAVLYLVVWILFFLIAYIGARSVYLVDDWLAAQTARSRLVLILMVGANLLAALISIPRA